jgi:hypothetical protein
MIYCGPPRQKVSVVCVCMFIATHAVTRGHRPLLIVLKVLKQCRCLCDENRLFPAFFLLLLPLLCCTELEKKDALINKIYTRNTSLLNPLGREREKGLSPASQSRSQLPPSTTK